MITRLDAKASGHPRPKITWYKNGEVIRWTPDCQISYDTSGISTLTIQRTESDDFGFYVCEAKNSYGVDMTECELVQLGMVLFDVLLLLLQISHSYSLIRIMITFIIIIIII